MITHAFRYRAKKILTLLTVVLILGACGKKEEPNAELKSLKGTEWNVSENHGYFASSHTISFFSATDYKITGIQTFSEEYKKTEEYKQTAHTVFEGEQSTTGKYRYDPKSKTGEIEVEIEKIKHIMAFSINKDTLRLISNDEDIEYIRIK